MPHPVQNHASELWQSHSNPLLSAARSQILGDMMSRSRSTTLLQEELNYNKPSPILSRLALFRADLKLRSAQVIVSSILPGLGVKSSEEDCARRDDAMKYDIMLSRLTSLPLITELLDIIRLPLESKDEITEETVLSAVKVLAKKPSSSWAPLVPALVNSFPTKSRTRDHYIAAVNISAKARTEARNSQKKAKFWKNVSRGLLSGKGGDVAQVISPSPSDISDTGIQDPISLYRQQNVECLMQRRKTGSSTLSPRSSLNSPLAMDKEHCQDEKTLVDISTVSASPNKVKVKVCRAEEAIAQLVPKVQESRGTSERFKPFSFLYQEHKIPRSLSRLTKSASGRRISSLPTVSVQTKRHMYESLVSSKSVLKSTSTHPGKMRHHYTTPSS